MDELTIAGRPIGPAHPPYVVAEIGANHNGDLDLCRRLIEAAAESGADAVKFQSWTKDSLISRGEYLRNTKYRRDGAAPSLEEAVARYQLGETGLRAVAEFCRSRRVVWFASCFARAEVDLLEALEAPAYKIASMDVNHLPLLDYVGRTGKPVLLSTGMATLGEVEQALGILRDAGAGPIGLLHCVSSYPCPPEETNLRMLTTWRQAFGVPVGYSDHTLGTAVPLAAVALGASAIEKHFTLSHDLEGWDHAISADPGELRALVDGARAVFASLGSGVRDVGAAELEKRKVFRRRMVASRALRIGDRISADDVEFKRPGTGIQPDELAYVLGRRLTRDVAAEEELEWADLA